MKTWVSVEIVKPITTSLSIYPRFEAHDMTLGQSFLQKLYHDMITMIISLYRNCTQTRHDHYDN